MFKKNGYIPPEPPMFKYENVQTEVEKPMNPNAKEAFREAIEKAKKCPAIDYLYFEPKYEEEHINRATLVWEGGAWQDFIGILLSNGYEVTAKCNDGIDINVTWKDKHDLVDEIKNMARELEVK